MKFHKHANDAVHWYLNELGCRVVANTGIPSDRHHIGKLILQSFKDAPNFTMEIDGATGESVTFKNALEKSVHCANTFRALGLKTDDVIVIMAPNHNNITIPLYAALYLGIYASCIDMTLGIKELQDMFQISLPKIIFCQSDKEDDVAKALDNINWDATIVTFNKSTKYCSFPEFLLNYEDNTPVDEFIPADFDPEEKTCLLISTSGTTGVPKCAALTHKNLMIGFPYAWMGSTEFPTPIQSYLLLSPAQWISAIFCFISSPMLRFTRIQTSRPLTPDHIYFLINEYKPSIMVVSPTMVINLMKPGDQAKCDFTCFKSLVFGGSAMPPGMLEQIKRVAPDAEIIVGYGFSEIAGPAFNAISAAPGSCGRPLTHLQYRLVDPATQEDILEPNVTGELWVRGPVTFKGYYNNPEVTAESYAEDGWIKSGDLFYRDESWSFFYVDRLKLLLKYRSHQISPIEVESVIMNHPGVLDVAVTGIPDDEDGDLPVACVVPKDNYALTAQEIKDLVKESLADSKQLRGGVIFMKELPLTSTSKVNRAMLKKIVKDMKRE